MIAGVDEFLDEVIVLPPGEWDPKIRIEPPKKVPSAEMRHENDFAGSFTSSLVLHFTHVYYIYIYMCYYYSVFQNMSLTPMLPPSFASAFWYLAQQCTHFYSIVSTFNITGSQFLT